MFLQNKLLFKQKIENYKFTIINFYKFSIFTMHYNDSVYIVIYRIFNLFSIFIFIFNVSKKQNMSFLKEKNDAGIQSI